jgi:hypothetical protein
MLARRHGAHATPDIELSPSRGVMPLQQRPSAELASPPMFQPASAVDDIAALRADYEKLRVAYELSRAMGEARDLETMLRAVVDTSVQLLGADRGAALLMDPESGELRPCVVRHRDG